MAYIGSATYRTLDSKYRHIFDIQRTVHRYISL